jgi:hypothetical protein
MSHEIPVSRVVPLMVALIHKASDRAKNTSALAARSAALTYKVDSMVVAIARIIFNNASHDRRSVLKFSRRACSKVSMKVALWTKGNRTPVVAK